MQVIDNRIIEYGLNLPANSNNIKTFIRYLRNNPVVTFFVVHKRLPIDIQFGTGDWTGNSLQQ